MVTVEQAKKLIELNVIDISDEIVETNDAVGRFFSQPIYAQIENPPFNQSAVDGYAFHTDYITPGNYYNVEGEIPAGISPEEYNNKKTIYRIFTGAAVPECCNSVVMQEKILQNNNKVAVPKDQIIQGNNIRAKGYSIFKGDLLFEKGEKITPASIGVLASQGISEVKVARLPKVACIISGSELQPITKKHLNKGEIYESNSLVLNAALRQQNITPEIFIVEDDEQKMNNLFLSVIDHFDVILFSGGISVGDYDFTGKILKANGVKEIFYKVFQKPGKPLYFGTHNNKAIFGLPGNPAAALTSMYIYVLPYINMTMGSNSPYLPHFFIPLKGDFNSKPGRTRFLKAITNFKEVEILTGQNSDMLLSFAKANCLVEIDKDISEIKKGEKVKVHLLPF
jgi:molybdopterin molybdotransferase